MPMSARPVSPRPVSVLVIVVLSPLSIETMPESPNSWPFCRSAVVVAVGTRFSVSSERVEVTTLLYASTSAWTFLAIASVSIAGWVVLTETGLVLTPLSVRRTPGIAFSTTLDSGGVSGATPSIRTSALRPVSRL